MNPSIFLEAPNFWTFWSFLLVKLHCSASLLHLAIFKKVHKFFEKPFYFFRTKNLSFLRFEKSYYFSCILQQTCCRGRILKNSRFFSRNQFLFQKEAKFRTFWENLLSQSHFTANLLPLSLFWKIGFFFEKTHPFVEKKHPIFGSSEKFYFFSDLVV